MMNVYTLRLPVLFNAFVCVRICWECARAKQDYSLLLHVQFLDHYFIILQRNRDNLKNNNNKLIDTAFSLEFSQL